MSQFSEAIGINVFLHKKNKLACSFKRSHQRVKGVNVLLCPQRVIIIIVLEIVACPQMSNGRSSMDSSWREKKGKDSWISHFQRQDAWPEQGASTATLPFRAYVHFHSRARLQPIRSNGVCPAPSGESPLMSGSHYDIIDGACWGISFHTTAMLQTSSFDTQCWWWQKSELTPDLLLTLLRGKYYIWIPAGDKKTAGDGICVA